jgi:tetratricopeptide (TPR) repeat protein
LEQRLRQHPYLLSRYFSWSEFIECVDSEDLETLWKALSASGGALATAVPEDGLRHPALADAQALGHRLRILGGPGSGKSFFVFQLLKMLPRSLVLILRSLDRAEVLAPIREISAWARAPLVLVLDNLHRSLTPTASCDALPLLFESSDLESRVVATLVTYWTSVRLEVEARVPSTSWHQWGFGELCLDDPPRDFIRGVIDAACSRLEIRADEAIRDAFVDSVIDAENTPACAVASVLPYAGKVLDSTQGFFPIEIRERELDWQHLFADVTRNDPASKSVLRTLAVLRASGVLKPSPELLGSLLSRLEGLAPGEVTGALERLQNRRWLRLDREGVFGHDLQLAPKTVRLYDEHGPSLFLRRLAAALINDGLAELAEFRRDVLHGLGHLFWQADDKETCATLNALLVEEDPTDQRARAHLGLCKLRQADVEGGLAELRAAKSGKAELGLVGLYLRECFRYGQTQAAVIALDELAARRPADGETVAFLAHGYADAGDPRKGLPWARRAAKLRPDDPRSPALLGELLWLSGGRRKQARVTVDKGLERWPTDGHLLGVKAIFDQQEGLAEAALEAASAALQAQPNEVRNHSLVAMLQFQLDRFDEARKTVELGRRLFANWPALVAVEGLLLLNDRKISDARVRLLNALEHQELLGSVLKPNVFLALGRIALSGGEGDEAARWLDEARCHGVPELNIVRLRVGVHDERGDPTSAVTELEEYLGQHNDAEASDWLDLARLLSRARRHRDSAEAVRRILELAPQDAENALMLGVELFLAGDSAQALPHLEAGIALGPEDPRQAALLLADCLIDLQRLPEAARAFEEADLLAPISHVDRVRYANTLACQAKYEVATEQIDRVLEEAPDHFQALWPKALYLLRMGQPERARTAALAARASWQGSEEGAGVLAQILADVDLIEAVLEIWEVARREGWEQFTLSRQVVYKMVKPLAAQRRLQEVLDLLIHCETKHGFEDATDLNIAHVLRRLDRADDALQRYDQLLERSPLYLSAVVERAELLNRLGRVDEALSSEAERYARLPPWLKHLYLAHVYTWAARQDPPLIPDGLPRAADELVCCAATLPDPPPPGVVEMPALVEAVKYLEIDELVAAAAARVADTGRDAEAASALYLLAFLANEERALLPRLQAAYERDPDRVTLVGNLARAKARAGDREAALAHARALACHTRAGCWGLGRASRVLLEAGAPAEEALDVAESAIIAAVPGDHSLPGAHHAKAAALNALERWEDALAAGRTALEVRDASEYVATVAQSLIGLGRQQEALDLAEEGLKHHPGDLDLSVTKASLLKSVGRYSDCRAFVDAMAHQGNLAPRILIDAAASLYREGRHQEALDFALRARELVDQVDERGGEQVPAGSEAEARVRDWRVRAVATIVTCLLDLGRHEAAMTELDELGNGLLLATPLWMAKAQILRDSGRMEELLVLARDRLEVAPEDQWARVTAVEALLALDRPEESLDESAFGSR